MAIAQIYRSNCIRLFILYLICIDVAEFYIDNFSVISGDSDILF